MDDQQLPLSEKSPRLSLRDRQVQRTKRDFIIGALEVIQRLGLDQASVQRITQQAGASRATLYSHFPEGRTELLIEAYRALGRQVVVTAEKRLSVDATWVDRIASYQESMIELAQDKNLGWFFNITGPQLVGLNQPGSGSSATTVAVETELRQAQADQFISDDVDVESVAVFLVGMIRETSIEVARDRSKAAARLAAFRALLWRLQD